MSDFAWTPTPAYVNDANVTRLMRAHGIEDYWELVRRSQDDPDWFWDAAVRDLGIQFFEPYTSVSDSSKGIPWTTWFGGSTVNLTHHCVDAQDPSARAIVWEGEDGESRTLTFGELRAEVDRVANGLAGLGIGRGDRVGLQMPMVPEVAIAIYACAKLGAVVLPIFSGFAGPAVVSRLQDAEAVALITADGFYRRGSVVPLKETADDAVAQCPTVKHVIVFRRMGRTDAPWTDGRDVDWSTLGPAEPRDAERLDPEHPLMIAYTSGTTGKPKGSVHVHGGFLVKIAEEAAYQTDIRPGELLFWFTDMGWIMGPWELVGANANGAAVLFYEGAPDYPKPDRVWEVVAKHRANVLGMSPTGIRALIPHGEDMVRAHDLSSLRILASTGEPWNPEPWRWYFEHVGGGRCPVINLSGGTEVGACFLSPSPLLPLRPCTLGGPALGMAIDVFDPSSGEPLGRNQVGELVCTKPWPGMTRGIWGDPQRYLETYWSRWENVWVHGDWASVDDDGFWYLHGRSDDTLKIAGKRLGPAEVESILVSHPAVAESAAIGVPDEVKGEKVWCYVVLKPGVAGTDAIAAELRALVSEQLGKAFRPDAVRFVGALPKTRSAKILRRAVKAAALGLDLGDLSSLENPAAIDEIRSLGS